MYDTYEIVARAITQNLTAFIYLAVLHNSPKILKSLISIIDKVDAILIWKTIANNLIRRFFLLNDVAYDNSYNRKCNRNSFININEKAVFDIIAPILLFNISSAYQLMMNFIKL